MVLSYSAAAKPAQPAPIIPTPLYTEPAAISSEVPVESAPAPVSASATTATPPTASKQPAASSSSLASGSNTQHLILDAGPLVSLTPLRHLAQAFHTTPMVVAELRDPKSREHWQRLGLMGVDVKVEMPKPDVMARVIAFAKRTGDYAVLSQTDLSVIALTCQYELEVNGDKNVRSVPGERKGPAPVKHTPKAKGIGKEKEKEGVEATTAVDATTEVPEEPRDTQEDDLESDSDEETSASRIEEVTEAVAKVDLEEAPQTEAPAQPGWKDEQEDSDGGEWINPSNVSKHRSKDLGLVPAGAGSDQSPMAAACMTGDYAVQNVLLSMGLGLIGEQGKRINKVKSWVLRCHACFKTCRDLDKRFCPSCGNATLLRTTVSTSSKTGKQTVHLKKNFQYALRGSVFSIPDSKAGRAKGQQKSGNGLIMREDQREWQDAVKSEDIRRQKEERKLAKGALDGWDNPDWLPEVLTVGMSGKGRSSNHNLPKIGHGRSNPNVARRKR